MFSSVKFGLKYTDHDREVVQTYGQRRALFAAGACGGQNCSLASVAAGPTPSDYLDGIKGAGVLSSYLTADKNKIEAIYAAMGPATIYDPNNPNTGAASAWSTAITSARWKASTSTRRPSAAT